MVARYQVFVSSTFRDLQEERQAVLNAIVELGHFPSGMEVFPAASSTPWQLIKKIISECDYYVLIIGGRYGTTDDNGISYTEKEYDLAQELSIPTLVFVHSDRGEILSKNVDNEPDAIKRLDAFIAKASKHHRKEWRNPDHLKSQVALGLMHETRVNPRIGWIRADDRDSPETLRKLTLLLEQNAALERENQRLQASISPDRGAMEHVLEHGDDRIVIRYRDREGHEEREFFTWNQLLVILGNGMINGASLPAIGKTLMRGIAVRKGRGNEFVKSVEPEDFSKVLIQFLGLEYWEPAQVANPTVHTAVSINGETTTTPAMEWVSGYKLTKLGIKRLAMLVAIRKKGADIQC